MTGAIVTIERIFKYLYKLHLKKCIYVDHWKVIISYRKIIQNLICVDDNVLII